MAQFVLGLDAAWTAHHPAGVALAKIPARGKPQLVRVARSYEEFCQIAVYDKIGWTAKVHGSVPNIPALLATCESSPAQRQTSLRWIFHSGRSRSTDEERRIEW